MKVSAIIPAAGSGKRMGGSVSKQYLRLGTNSIIAETLSVFQASSLIDEIILVSPSNEMERSREIVQEAGLDKVSKFIEGGAERQDSVGNGLDAIDSSTDIVVIHDGVRPFIDNEILTEVIRTAEEHGTALLAVPVKETVKEVSGAVVSKTVPRESLWLAQTPQAFRYEIIREAFDQAKATGLRGTDESSLVEAIGKEVKIVKGSYKNIKITTEEDLLFANAIWEEINQ